jgi:mannose-1-phosphate guanylyltransferase
MLEFDGRPLLDMWLESLHKAGVDEVLVNLHHLPGVVEAFLRGRSAPPAVHTVFEPELLGSAGTLLTNRNWVEGEDFFLACNADNLTDFALGTLVEHHRARHAAATLSVFRAPDPSACGIVELDAEGVVVGFVEKPSDPVSDLANAGMYAFEPRVLDEIDGRQPLDIGYDLLPHLVGRAHTVLVDTYFRDIGTVDAYQTARQEWDSRTAR